MENQNSLIPDFFVTQSSHQSGFIFSSWAFSARSTAVILIAFQTSWITSISFKPASLAEPLPYSCVQMNIKIMKTNESIIILTK